MNLNWSFHHVGMACRDIASEASDLRALGYCDESDDIVDPIQRVRIRFMVGMGPRIELIQPLTPDSPVQGLIKRGTKYYHLAFETSQFKEMIAQLEKHDYRAITDVVPAVAFSMRSIVFMISPTMSIVELIEAAP